MRGALGMRRSLALRGSIVQLGAGNDHLVEMGSTKIRADAPGTGIRNMQPATRTTNTHTTRVTHRMMGTATRGLQVRLERHGNGDGASSSPTDVQRR